MGRAEQRKLERRNRIEGRKGKVLMTKQDIAKMKEEISKTASEYNAESLMTCFALTEHRLYGFGQKRILRTLSYIDELMGSIVDGTATIDDYKKELEEKGNVVISCVEER